MGPISCHLFKRCHARRCFWRSAEWKAAHMHGGAPIWLNVFLGWFLHSVWRCCSYKVVTTWKESELLCVCFSWFLLTRLASVRWLFLYFSPKSSHCFFPVSFVGSSRSQCSSPMVLFFFSLSLLLKWPYSNSLLQLPTWILLANQSLHNLDSDKTVLLKVPSNIFFCHSICSFS